MNKAKLSLLCAVLSLGAHAGTMGEVGPASTGALFIAAEGGWTWNQHNGLDISIADIGRIFTDKQQSLGSARLSIGGQRYVSDCLAAVAEIGYGYYGQSKFHFNAEGPVSTVIGTEPPLNYKITNDGFDVLGGLSYSYSAFDLFFKAGAMIENARQEAQVDLSQISGGGIAGRAGLNFDRTQVFPEIKLGVDYRWCPNLAFMASWMHVFGESPRFGIDVTSTTPFAATIVVDRQNTRLDALLLGATYYWGV